MLDLKNIFSNKISIIGAGKLGQAIAKGFLKSGKISANQITLTRRNRKVLSPFKKQGFIVSSDNCDAVSNTNVVIVSVDPQGMKKLLEEIAPLLITKKHVLISTVTGVDISELRQSIPSGVPVFRIMPNVAIAIGESMTCISCDKDSQKYMSFVNSMFEHVGKTMIIPEDLMGPATSLGAAGLAFFLRAIRAASQGGSEIGFHAEESITISAQAAKGAATLLLERESHPEAEIDTVTTPRGITIAGLNEMEHQGFSSAMIKGIVTSAEKINKLLAKKD